MRYTLANADDAMDWMMITNTLGQTGDVSEIEIETKTIGGEKDIRKDEGGTRRLGLRRGEVDMKRKRKMRVDENGDDREGRGGGRGRKQRSTADRWAAHPTPHRLTTRRLAYPKTATKARRNNLLSIVDLTRNPPNPPLTDI